MRWITRPSPSMTRAIRRALELERGPQGTPWVAGRYRRTAPAVARRGWADTYRVTADGQLFYVLNTAGRALAGEVS